MGAHAGEPTKNAGEVVLVRQAAVRRDLGERRRRFQHQLPGPNCPLVSFTGSAEGRCGAKREGFCRRRTTSRTADQIYILRKYSIAREKKACTTLQTHTQSLQSDKEDIRDRARDDGSNEILEFGPDEESGRNLDPYSSSSAWAWVSTPRSPPGERQSDHPGKPG
jgi:hypothetical protein